MKVMDKKHIEAFLVREGCEWVFNPPHASHADEVWEHMIGIARRILDSMLSELASKQLTHEVLSTLMAKVTAIVNNRPLIPVSNDPEAPEILTPSTLLTQKPLVLLRSKEVVRNRWPLARVTKAQESAGGKVRKVDLLMAKDGVKHTYSRPVNEVILLKTVDELNSEH